MKAIADRLLHGETVLMDEVKYSKLIKYLENEIDDLIYKKFQYLTSDLNKEYSLGTIQYYNVYLKKRISICSCCNHKNKFTSDMIYQDVTGKFIVCDKCKSFICIE